MDPPVMYVQINPIQPKTFFLSYYGHVCLTFEVLGESVFDFLKSNGYVPYPPAQVAHISMQLCRAVAFMHDRYVASPD